MHTILSNDLATDTLAKELNERLKVGDVLLLLSGGSSIPIGVGAVLALPSQVTHRLHIGLTDERYGTLLHADSNWKAILEAGLPLERDIHIHPIITSDELSLGETAAAYEATLRSLLETTTSVIALFGIGEDDHIAGMLPDSPAAKEVERFVVGYDAGAFKRITITPPFFDQITVAVVSARGIKKRDAIARLSEKLDSVKHPDQLILRAAKHQVFFSL